MAPVVAIVSPVNGATVDSSPITVSGTVDDDTATVTVNGIGATVAGGTFTADAVPVFRKRACDPIARSPHRLFHMPSGSWQ